MIKNISATSKNAKAAVNQLKEGNIIVYPTDTLYGFGVDASNETAIIKLNKLKERAQPLSILLSNINEIIAKLTNIGLEVEGVKEGSGNMSEFKIAKILKAENEKQMKDNGIS